MLRGVACVLTAMLSVACGGHARMGSTDEEPAPAESPCEADAEPRALLAGASARAGLVSIDVRGSSLVAAFQYSNEGAGELDGVVHQLDLESGERTVLALARGNPRSVAIGGTAAYWIDATPLPQLLRAPLGGSSTPAQLGSANAATVVVDEHLYYGRDDMLMAQPARSSTWPTAIVRSAWRSSMVTSTSTTSRRLR